MNCTRTSDGATVTTGDYYIRYYDKCSKDNDPGFSAKSDAPVFIDLGAVDATLAEVKLDYNYLDFF
jgi:hypothetical protein